MSRPCHATLLATLLLTSACPGNGEDADDEVGETDDTTETGETGETETGEGGLAIIGEYTDEWGDTHVITDSEWTNSAGTFHIEQWDNDAMFVIAHNDPGNVYNGDLWSRFDWAWSNDDLFYCQSVYDGPTLEDALAGSADPTDLAMGCGGFAWTNLTP